jgi:hypothetical protein
MLQVSKQRDVLTILMQPVLAPVTSAQVAPYLSFKF